MALLGPHLRALVPVAMRRRLRDGFEGERITGLAGPRSRG
jgi:hypothetical protein